MRKVLNVAIFCLLAVMTYAVPARRGWQTRTQADGTTIEVQQFGDEFYHYMINLDGKEVREIDGQYVVVGEAPTADMARARRAKGVARRQRQDIGVDPNLAPKGVVILVNFSNKAMQSGHTQTVFDELCNSLNCTVNSGYPSAAQYFADQSNGAYRPIFDVFGPVTLSRNVAYYGTDNPGQDEGDDQHATDAVVEGCRLANEQFNINWADYDSNNDGYVDFVYVIYAGQGQADGGASNTIWPHNWSVTSAIQYGYCTYTSAQRTLGGKKIDNYAISSELSGNALGGIGTLCHEFGHVMGLPDLYDTSYGTNYENCLTPNDWNIMDGGAYNADGHCPPNYDPWEKEFFGWHTTINLGTEGQNLTLKANGTEGYQAYQINASGSYVSPTTAGLRYYIENRQAVGWDRPLTGHGLLIWKVNFNASKWTNNEPNNTANNPYYTVVSASGTKIGWDGYTDHCPKNTFPGSGNKTSWSGVSDKPILNISESNRIVTLTYIEEPTTPIEPFTLTWMANGAEFATTTSAGTVVLPDNTPEACSEGKQFVGWCTTADYRHATLPPALVRAGDAVSGPTTYYAVYADVTGEGSAEETTTFTFNSKAWGDPTNGWNSIKDGYAYDSNKQGVQVTANATGASAETKIVFNIVKKIVVTYCTNATSGAGSVDMTVGETEISKSVGKAGGSTLRELEYTFDQITGKVNIKVNCTANSIYIHSVAVTAGGGLTFANYSTSCTSGTELIEIVSTEVPAAYKTILNGQLVIIRGDEIYSITGARLQ